LKKWMKNYLSLVIC